jgi:hypothetical protein
MVTNMGCNVDSNQTGVFEGNLKTIVDGALNATIDNIRDAIEAEASADELDKDEEHLSESMVSKPLRQLLDNLEWYDRIVWVDVVATLMGYGQSAFFLGRYQH